MARTHDFISYEPRNGFVNVYEHRDDRARWYGGIHERRASDAKLRMVRAAGGHPVYRIRIRLKPSSPNTGS